MKSAVTKRAQSRLLFVNYHYIRDKAAYRYPGIHPISMDEFRTQIEMLLELYRCAMPSEVEAFALEDRALPEPCVVPTFDDGLIDHWKAACAVLDPLGIKGAFFACSRPAIDKRALTAHKIQWLRAHTESSEFSDEFFSLIPPALRPTGLEGWIDRAERAYKYDTPAVARLKFALNFVLPDELVDEITSQMFVNRGIDERRFCEETYMSDAHLRALAERGHVVGVHGHTHSPFSRLRENLYVDVGINVGYLTDILGRPPSWVAYPYGRADAIPDGTVLARLFRRFDFKIGLTLMGTWNFGDENPTQLNRINTNEVDAIAAADRSTLA